MKTRAVIVCAISLALAVRLVAQIPAGVPNARKIQDYVSAFNSGETQMAEFIKNNAALDKRPLDERVAVYRQMAASLKSLEIRAVSKVDQSAEQNSVTVQAHTGSNENVSITFNFDPQPPNKLISIRIEDSGGSNGQDAQPAGPPISKTEFAGKVAAQMDELAAKDEFSGALLVTRDGQTLFEKAYGMADKDRKVLNNLETRFNIGSINKAFTRVAIEQLAQQGKLSFDDNLGKFLPDYPNREAAQKVTVSELLTMTSGIGDFFGERFQAADKSKLRTLADYLPLFADQPLLFEPGTQNRYSNGGYLVLGLIVQKVSGEDYFEYVKRHIFEPAGMKETDSYLQEEKVANRAEGYVREGTVWKNNRTMQPARGSSAGGGYSTAHDLLRFATALSAGKLGNFPDHGGPRPGPMAVAGGSPGVNAELFFDPATRSAVIVLSNYDPPSAEAPARTIEQWLSAVKD
jgi:CubicO group peptidase (beta-lactamase class C family)